MSAEDTDAIEEDEQRIVALVGKLCEAEEELQKLTGGQLDSVAGPGGKPYLLAEAQDRLRTSEEAQRASAETLTAILDALPAHIALIDSEGLILKVNRLWEVYAINNSPSGSIFGVGLNYLDICDRAGGRDASAREAAAGIRAVLKGNVPHYALEYPCHSPRKMQWFRLTVTPVQKDRRSGAVVMHVDVTERRLAAESLRVTMEEFRTLAEAVPQIVWMTRPDGWNIYFNQQWMDYTGLTLEESLGDGWNKPFHPEDGPRAWEAWRKAVSEVGDYNLEARLRRADGEYRWWLSRGVPQKDAAGKVLKWFGTSTDIHDLKMAELEIARMNRALTMLSACNEKLIRAKSEAELLTEICRVVTEIGGYRMAWVGYARDDEDSTIEPVAFAGKEDGYLKELKISWSENEHLGLGPAGRAIRSGEPEICEDTENDPYFSPLLDKMRQRGYRGVICLPLRDGRSVFGILALYTAEPLSVGAKEMHLLTELANDLAFGVEHLRAIGEIEDQAALLNAASDAIILRNINNKILFWNQGAERMFGWRSLEVVGDDPRQIYMRDTAKYNEGCQLLMANGTWAGELPIHCKDEREIIVDARWTLVRDEEAKPKSVLAIYTDITERKKLEAQLLRVQRMESIGTLAGGIAHDLNNALSPVLMGAAVLQYEVTSEKGQQILAAMETSAQHGADLVRQVLSFARGVEGNRIPVNIGNVLDGIRDMVRDVFPKNIHLIHVPSGELWNVIGDSTQINQVLTNLCVNARDAMPHGGTLKIGAENTVLDEVYAGMNPGSKPGAYVVIEVEDTGSGIPPAIRDRIFEPFFTTKKIGEGTGLGLSTTLGIVKNHGGFINLYSEMGKGSTFKVYLPADTTSAAAENVAIRQTELPRGNGELILLVDDEVAIRSVAQKTLERFGYRVLIAANGAEGVALYAQYRDQIAAVLTDMAMPVMDGPAMIVALKSMNPEVKIVGSSGLAADGGVAKAMGSGVQHFVPKPYTAEGVLKVLAEALRKQED
jgi:PAS domain S-box-containing protein